MFVLLSATSYVRIDTGSLTCPQYCQPAAEGLPQTLRKASSAVPPVVIQSVTFLRGSPTLLHRGRASGGHCNEIHLLNRNTARPGRSPKLAISNLLLCLHSTTTTITSPQLPVLNTIFKVRRGCVRKCMSVRLCVCARMRAYMFVSCETLVMYENARTCTFEFAIGLIDRTVQCNL
eukprot:jgi/Chlat1/1944/Chrsp153S02255